MENFDFKKYLAEGKMLNEDSQPMMSSMDYLREELPHLYNSNGDISQSDITYAMDLYAEYVNSFSKS